MLNKQAGGYLFLTESGQLDSVRTDKRIYFSILSWVLEKKIMII